jgi:hypothetical protein
MRIRRSLITVFFLALIAGGAFVATSSLSAKPELTMLPAASVVPVICPPPAGSEKESTFAGLGTFKDEREAKPNPLMVRTGPSFISSNGLKTVPLEILAIGWGGSAEGLGETHFWMDTTRPLTSAIWEKTAGTEFPAIQEMRFHFFYTVEAMPGKVFRTINPARMRSTDVRAFPPPPGTVYHLVEPIQLEEIHKPGVVAGRIQSNRMYIPKPSMNPSVREG